LAYLWLCLAALAAGVVNSVAGGGTLLTFPTLFHVLRSARNGAVVANATSTVALVPGSLASAWGYRQEMKEARRWFWLLLGPCLAGGVVGALLLTVLDPRYFDALVPWLILAAALLFLAQPTVLRWSRASKHQGPPSARMVAFMVVFQFFVAIYGGYFGAGIGILMLSALGVMGMGDIHQMNALKTVLGAVINGVAVLVFIAENTIAWRYALAMTVAAIVGGYFGARVARRLQPQLVRGIVIVIGFSLAAFFFYQRWRGTEAQPPEHLKPQAIRRGKGNEQATRPRRQPGRPYPSSVRS